MNKSYLPGTAGEIFRFVIGCQAKNGRLQILAIEA